jgi:2-iminoacetate synthase ThiH
VVELTSTCNLACVHCYAESGLQVRDHNPLTTAEYLAVLDAASAAGCTAVQFIGGEPTLYRATRLDHRTTPLVATDEDAEPQGMVLVGPYFLRGSGPARN